MKRRQVLGLGIAAGAAVALPGAAAQMRWSLQAGANRYDITLDGAILACDSLGPGEAAGFVLPSSHEPWRFALAAIGPQRLPVSWRVLEAVQSGPGSLSLALRAEDAALRAEASFEVDPASRMLCRRTVLHHDGEGPPVELRATLAGLFSVHAPVEQIFTLHGDWAEETQIRRTRPGDTPLVLQSRAGKTGFGLQPWVGLRTGTASAVCQLLWSGNWLMRVLPEAAGVTILGGLNAWRFHHVLTAGNSVALPDMLFGRAEGDLNGATQALHDWRRAHRPDPRRPVPVQFNSWYPYFGEPTAAALLAMVPQAKRLGCEAFVIDAGWFRTGDDDSDADWSERTGDWHISRRRFPNGLTEIAAACREQALRFGLWFEPEVLGQLSVIRRNHPDWLHCPDGRAPADSERAVLNLGVPAAWAYVRRRVSLLLAGLEVAWMKWDFNADIHNGGWAPGLPGWLTRQDPLVAHYEGLYALLDTIRGDFPDLVLEMCASGGGRMDGGIMGHAHVNWISDQPSPVRKLAIHFGSQLAHPAVVCNDWLVEWPPGVIAGYDDNTPGLALLGDLAFRLRVAMLGSFGISARVDRWNAADFATVAAHVAFYREKLRAIIQEGDQYLLTRPPDRDGDGDWAGVWYAAKDASAGVLFAFRLAGPDALRVFALPGLTEGQSYRCRNFGGDATLLAATAPATHLPVILDHHYRSELVLVEAA